CRTIDLQDATRRACPDYDSLLLFEAIDPQGATSCRVRAQQGSVFPRVIEDTEDTSFRPGDQADALLSSSAEQSQDRPFLVGAYLQEQLPLIVYHPEGRLDGCSPGLRLR